MYTLEATAAISSINKDEVNISPWHISRPMLIRRLYIYLRHVKIEEPK
jgi:hypothetical protein